MKIVLFSGVALLVASTSAWAASVNIGDTGSNNSPSAVKRITNNTGRDADDFHFSVRVKEPTNDLEGLAISTDQFDTISATRVNNYTYRVSLDDGTVAAGEDLVFDIEAFIRLKNVVWTFDEEWTFDDPANPGQPDPVAPRVPSRTGTGFTVGDPWPVDDYWIHRIGLWNLENKDATITDLKVLASYNYYDDLVGGIDWDSISPVNLPDTAVGPGEALYYDFPTLTSFLGGHIYLSYRYIDDEADVFGEHPVVSQVPVPVSLVLMMTGFAGLGALRSRRMS